MVQILRMDTTLKVILCGCYIILHITAVVMIAYGAIWLASGSNNGYCENPTLYQKCGIYDYANTTFQTAIINPDMTVKFFFEYNNVMYNCDSIKASNIADANIVANTTYAIGQYVSAFIYENDCILMQNIASKYLFLAAQLVLGYIFVPIGCVMALCLVYVTIRYCKNNDYLQAL